VSSKLGNFQPTANEVVDVSSNKVSTSFRGPLTPVVSQT
jgi:hypothetical protein